MWLLPVLRRLRSDPCGEICDLQLHCRPSCCYSKRVDTAWAVRVENSAAPIFVNINHTNTQTQHSVLDLLLASDGLSADTPCVVHCVASLVLSWLSTSHHGTPASPHQSVFLSLSGLRGSVPLVQSESRVNGCGVLPGNQCLWPSDNLLCSVRSNPSFLLFLFRSSFTQSL